MTVGQRIHNRRTEIGLSVDKLAEQIGKNRATVYRYENNDIENLPLPIIEELSMALKTTPAYLMGWEPEQDEWTKTFCNSVHETMTSYDKTDCSDAGVNYDRLFEIAEGISHISLSEACDIADALGRSLDTMVGLNNDDTSKFVPFEQALSHAEKRLLEMFRSMNGQGQEFIMQAIDMAKDKYCKEKAPSVDEAM